MEKDGIEEKLYQLVAQLNGRKISCKQSYSKFLDNVHSFYDRNGRTNKIFWVNKKIFSIFGIQWQKSKRKSGCRTLFENAKYKVIHEKSNITASFAKHLILLKQNAFY